jgi:DNA-binding XRE family transcriptional regulator
VGLKHLLGVFVAAEDACVDEPLPGGFVLDLNRHLDRLGFKRSKVVAGQKAHSAEHLTEARSVLRLLCESSLVQEIRLGPRRGTTIRIRFLIDEATSEGWHETVAEGERSRERAFLRERVFLRINPYLYSTALKGEREQQAFYTYQLRQLVRENAEQRPWVLILGTALPVRFGLSGGAPVRESLRSVLDLGGASLGDPAARVQVEETLKYMVERGYLGAFETERFRYEVELRQALSAAPGQPPKPRLILKPATPGNPGEDEIWQIEPPHFLPELLHRASRVSLQTNGSAPDFARNTPAEEPMLPGMEGMTERTSEGEMLRLLRERLGLSQGQLARTLGYTQAAISMAEAGKRPRMAKKIIEAARQIKPGD